MARIVQHFTPHLTTFINVQDVIPFLDAILACHPAETGRVALNLPLPGALVPAETTLCFEVPLERRIFGRPPLPLFLKPLSPNKLLCVFASLLMERRVIVQSNHVDRLTHFMFGITSLLYPLEWPHPFSPVLCERGLGYCAATFPFLFGVHSSLVPQVLEQALESVTWVNLDAGTVSNPEDDMQFFRSPAVGNRLTSAIEAERSKVSRKPYKSNGDALWNPFLSFWSSIIIPCLKTVVEPEFKFSSIAAVKICDSALRSILTKVADSQLFQQYIDDRMPWLKGECKPIHEFDIAASRLVNVRSMTTLDAYFESMSLHGLDVIISSLVQPTPSEPIVRISSPPVAIFSNALSPSSSTSSASSNNDSERRALPRRPTLKSRPVSGAWSSPSVTMSPSDTSRQSIPPSYTSSSCAPSSISSFELESAPPSFDSDLLHPIDRPDLMIGSPSSSDAHARMRMSTPPNMLSHFIATNSPSGSPQGVRHTASLSSTSSGRNTTSWERVGATARLRESSQKPWDKGAAISPESGSPRSPTATFSLPSDGPTLSDGAPESPPSVATLPHFSSTNPFASTALYEAPSSKTLPYSTSSNGSSGYNSMAH